MNGILLFVSFILLSDLFERVYCQNDNCLDLSQCVTKLKDLTQEENMAFAHNEEHLEELCGKLKEAVDCVNTFIRRCLDSISQLQYEAQTNGSQKLIRDLCTKDSAFRTEYLKHAKCYHKHQKEYQICSERFNSFDLNQYKDQDQQTQIKIWCCNFDGHRSCTYHSVLDKCGKGIEKGLNKKLNDMFISKTRLFWRKTL